MKHTQKKKGKGKSNEQCTNISTSSSYRGSQGCFFVEGRAHKAGRFRFPNPGFCFGVLICLSRGQKRTSLCFPAHALLLIPHSSWKQFFFLVFLSLKTLHLLPPPSSSSPSSLPNTYPTLSCPSCPLARSEVETCVFPAPAWRERKKSEVRSLPLALTPPLPAEASRQTGASHGTFINPRQIAMNPLHSHWPV